MSDKISTRLNFQVSEEAEERLSDYCSTSGRSTSDVVRQLLYEYVEGVRALTQDVGALNGRRTNCTLPAALVEKLDVRVRQIGQGATKGMVISNLLENWSPDSAGAYRVLKDLTVAVKRGDTSVALKNAESFLGMDREGKDG